MSYYAQYYTIAEGSGRKSKKDFQHFVHVASGSLNEVESLLHICLRLDFVKPNAYQDLRENVDKVGRLIGGLLKYLGGK
jgi:four helix bundle protein